MLHDEKPSIDELMHFGVKGMKWGKRRVGVTSNRQNQFDKRDLKRLQNGGHTSVGITKKRQAAFDKRDKTSIEKSIQTYDEKQNNKGRSSSRLSNAITKTSANIQNMKANYSRARVKGFKIDRDSLVGERKAMLGLKSSSGKTLFTEKDMDDMIGGLEKNIQKYSTKADTYDKIAKMLMKDVDDSRRK